MNYQFNFTPVFQNADLLLEGVLLTIQLSAAAMAIGLLIGIVGAVIKICRPSDAVQHTDRRACGGRFSLISAPPCQTAASITFTLSARRLLISALPA